MENGIKPEARASLTVGQSVDDLLTKLRPLGRYQFVQMVLITLGTVQVAFGILIYVFLGYEPPTVCKSVESRDLIKTLGFQNDTVIQNVTFLRCNIRVDYSSGESNTSMATVVDSCPNGYDITSTGGTTLVTEWDLFCDKHIFVQISQMNIMIGQAVSGVLLSHLSDSLGRKPVFVVSQLLTLVLCCCSAASPNIIVYSVFRFFIGMSIQSLTSTVPVMSLELFPTKYRGRIGTLGYMAWTTGVVALALFAFLFRNLSWRYLQIATALTGITCFASFFLVDESLRWLIAKEKWQQAGELIVKISKWNGVDEGKELSSITRRLVVETDIPPEDKPKESSFSSEKDKTLKSRHGLIAILTHANLFKITAIMFVCRFMVNFSYMGLFFMSSPYTDDNLINYLINGVVEYPCFIVMCFVINKVERGRLLFLCCSIAGVTSFLSAMTLTSFLSAIKVMSTVGAVFIYITKMTISATAIVLNVFTPELFPTNIRTVGLGIALTGDRLGAIASPYINNLLDISAWVPGIVFSVVFIISGFGFLTLPKTRTSELPQHLNDVNS